MGIFKAYDIRGVYGRDLTDETMYRIARAYVQYLKARRLIVAHDCRTSSAALNDAFLAGATEEGADVLDIGLASTPMSYFANALSGADGSVMITASHNTKEWNGCKLCRAKAVPISGATGLKEIEALASQEDLGSGAERRGSVVRRDSSREYARYIASKVQLAHPIHVAVDFANGMGIAESAAFAGTGLTFDALYDTFDGDFPHHEANPLKTETMADLQTFIRTHPGKYAFGVAFDGDADRAGFTDENGDIIPMDFMTALLAQEMLRTTPGATCLYDLRSSRVVPEVIAAAGGKPVMSRVGHSFIKAQMRENDAVFAGELSGHYYFKANSTAESSSLAVLTLAGLLSRSDKPLSELVMPLRKYTQSGEINSRVADAGAVLDRIKAAYPNHLELDGVSVDCWEEKGWWFNVRMSNTEPLVRLNLEAKSAGVMLSERDRMLEMIRR